MSLHLEFFEDTACFRHPPEYETCVEEFDHSLDERGCGRIGQQRYMDRLRDLAERHPWFIDAHAHVGNVLLNEGKASLALEGYSKGFAPGDAAIPPGHADLIVWSHLKNQPFIRAAHGPVPCYLHLRVWNLPTASKSRNRKTCSRNRTFPAGMIRDCSPSLTGFGSRLLGRKPFRHLRCFRTGISMEMTALLPRTLDALAECHGVGPRKLDRNETWFLDEIRAPIHA